MLRWAGWLVWRTAVGAFVIWAVNGVGVGLALNPLTAMMVGLLGVPGLLAQWGLTAWLL